MLAWLHHTRFDVTISGDAIVSLGLITLMVTCFCGAVVISTLRRPVL